MMCGLPAFFVWRSLQIARINGGESPFVKLDQFVDKQQNINKLQL